MHVGRGCGGGHGQWWDLRCCWQGRGSTGTVHGAWRDIQACKNIHSNHWMRRRSQGLPSAPVFCRDRVVRLAREGVRLQSNKGPVRPQITSPVYCLVIDRSEKRAMHCLQGWLLHHPSSCIFRSGGAPRQCRDHHLLAHLLSPGFRECAAGHTCRCAWRICVSERGLVSSSFHVRSVGVSHACSMMYPCKMHFRQALLFVAQGAAFSSSPV
jgi:hypothetical protein